MKENYGNMSKKSLPSYWTNINEIGILFSRLLNLLSVVDYGKQKIKGLNMEVNHRLDEQDLVWSPEEDFVIITGIEFAPNENRNIGYDNSFDLYIDDKKLFEDIYIKEVGEYKRFEVRKILDKNSKLKFVLKNKDKLIENVMFHIHYIGDLEIKKYVIYYIDEETGEIITQNEIYFSIDGNDEIQNICPIDIDGYETSSSCIEINPIEDEDVNYIEFYYNKNSNDINHDYDYMIRLYWNDLSVDFDLYCSIDGEKDICYYNRNLYVDDNNIAWLDQDYAGIHNHKDVEEPEIITILGFTDRKARISVKLYSSSVGQCTELLVEVLKKSNENGELITICSTELTKGEIENNFLEQDYIWEVVEIDLATGNFQLL